MCKSYEIWIERDINSIQFSTTSLQTGQERSLECAMGLWARDEAYVGTCMCSVQRVTVWAWAWRYVLSRSISVSWFHQRCTSLKKKTLSGEYGCILLLMPPSKHGPVRFKWEQPSVYPSWGPWLSPLILTGSRGGVWSTAARQAGETFTRVLSHTCTQTPKSCAGAAASLCRSPAGNQARADED